jgi:hypothetical protein
MTDKHPLTPEEISAIVDGFDPIDWEEIEMMAKLPPSQRYLVSLRKTEIIRADLRNKLKEDFPELSMPEINMKVLRSLTPVCMGKSYTEPAYYGSLC